MNLWESLRDSTRKGMFLRESQTLWPGHRVGAGLRLRLAWCWYCWETLRSLSRAFFHVKRQRLTNCWAEGTATSTSCSGNSGGVYPNWPSKGDWPVAEDRRVLWAYSAHMIKRDQEDGLLAAIHLSVVSRSWLSLSVCPLDSGWNPEDRLTVAPRDWQNAHQNREENWGPRSETMSCGMPKTRKMWFITNSAVYFAVGSLGWGINRAALENLSTTTRIVVLPCDSVSPVIKSMERWDQGGPGSGPI